MKTLVLVSIQATDSGEHYFLKSFDSVSKEYYLRPFGGHLRQSESVEECARRELLEELGWRPRNSLFLLSENIHESFLGRTIKPKKVIQLKVETLRAELPQKEIREAKRFLGVGVWKTKREAQSATLFPIGYFHSIEEEESSGSPKFRLSYLSK